MNDIVQVEAALRSSEYRARAIVEHSPALMWLKNSAGVLTLMNARFRDYTGQTVETHDFAEAVHPDDRAERSRAHDYNISRGEPYHGRYRCRMANGDYHWLNVSVSPVPDEDGAIVAWVGSAVDIDAQVRQMEVQDTLIEELNHRVRNTLAIINTMASATMRDAISLEDFGKKFEGRLTGLSATYDILVKEQFESASLSEIIAAEMRPHADARWTISASDLRLSHEKATPIGMLFHELATNAVKHGALSGDGRVAIGWTVTAGRLKLTWREHDGPPVVTPSRKGFGTKLIIGIGRQLLGRATLDYSPTGLVFVLDIPIL